MAIMSSEASVCRAKVSATTTIAQKAFCLPVLLGVLLATGASLGVYWKLSDFPAVGDNWWHLAVGEKILHTASWPTTDAYSYSASGSDWIAYEWGGDVLMAQVARLGGLPSLTALMVGLAALLLLLFYYYAYLRSGNVQAAFVACALMLPAVPAFLPLRPQLLGYLFLLLTLISLEQFRQGRRRVVWVLPVLFLVWVNTHGTFVLGLLVLGLYWASGLMEFRKGGLFARRWTISERRQLAWVMLLCVLVLPLTPYGTRLAAYPLELILFQPINVANILEWQPLSFDSSLGKLFLGLVLAFFLSQVVSPLTFRLDELGLLLISVYSACAHRRLLLFFLLIFTPLLAIMLSHWLPAYAPRKVPYLSHAILIALLGAAIVGFFPSKTQLERIVARTYPRDALKYLSEHPVNGRLLNDYNWGGYLIWSQGLNANVFIDGRTDIYEYNGVLADYLSITGVERNALFLLTKYGVSVCLLPQKAPLATVLATLPDWKLVHSDDVSVVFVRREQPRTPLRAGS